MSEKNYAPETVVPIGRGVVGTFAKEHNIYYAKHDNGAMYISNGQYLMKTNQDDFDSLLEQVNKRRRTDIAVIEKTGLLAYVNEDRGKYELSHEPLEFEMTDNLFISLFADDKQYFGYNKKYVDIFSGGENGFFIDDNAGYDPNSHNMIIKSGGGEVLGVVLPIRLTDEFYADMADIMPLKIKWKTEVERIKANPTNDPYIGKEFFDGRDNYIISAIRKVGGDDMYLVPTIENGKLSRSGAYIRVDEIESQITLWEENRVSRKNEKPAPPAEKETPPAPEENSRPVRVFTHLKKSPWGEVQASERLCSGVFMVSGEKSGGVMVARDMTAALSPAALKCGVKHNGYVCFEDNGGKEVALRELLDKKLWSAPSRAEEKINESLRKNHPQYWRSWENKRETAPPAKSTPSHDNR